MEGEGAGGRGEGRRSREGFTAQSKSATGNPRSFPRGSSGKAWASQYRRRKRCRSDPWVRKTPGRRKWQPALVLLPGKSHGQRSLVGCSPWVTKSQTRLGTEHACVNIRSLNIPKHTQTHRHTHTHTPDDGCGAGGAGRCQTARRANGWHQVCVHRDRFPFCYHIDQELTILEKCHPWRRGHTWT